MGKHLLIVLSNATEGNEAEFNDWYTNTHLGDILKLKPYVAAQRFQASASQLGTESLPYRFLAIYEAEADDIAEVAGSLGADSVGAMYISPALDMNATVAWLYSPITDRVTRGTAGGD